jgi:peptidoglycan hydrolase CwlO-like protein
MAVWLVAGFAGVASAQTAVEDQYAARDDEIPTLRARVEGQEDSLEARIGEITAVGAELEEAQSRVDSARARAGDLGEQTRSLERDLTTQRETFETAKAGYEEKARAAYKGGDLESLSSLLGGMLGSTEGLASVADPRLAGILLEGRESLEAYRRSEVTLQNTSRQISQKKRDYEDALQEEKAQTGELRSREQDLREVIAAISSRKARTESRLRELRAAERARILEQKAATAAGGTQLGYEIGIARDDIVSEAVEPISKSAYRNCTGSPPDSTGSERTGTSSRPWGRSSRTTGRTWARPPPGRWVRCSSCHRPGRPPGSTATATGWPT